MWERERERRILQFSKNENVQLINFTVHFSLSLSYCVFAMFIVNCLGQWEREREREIEWRWLPESGHCRLVRSLKFLFILYVASCRHFNRHSVSCRPLFGSHLLYFESFCLWFVRLCARSLSLSGFVCSRTHCFRVLERAIDIERGKQEELNAFQLQRFHSLSLFLPHLHSPLTKQAG